MLVAGGLTALYMVADSCIFDKNDDVVGRKWTFNWNLLSFALIGVTAAASVTWWFYPWHVDTFSVAYETGEVWRSSRLFPQTLYTIDLNPHDNINAGEWHYMPNDLVHGWNTLVKVLFTLCVFNIGLVKKVKS